MRAKPIGSVNLPAWRKAATAKPADAASESVNMPRTLIVDADPIAYLAALNAKTSEDATRCAMQMVDKRLRDLEATHAYLAFSDVSRRYFRHDLLPSYKPKRSERPAHYGAAIDGLRANGYSVKTLPGLEADDVCGILATAPWIGGERIVVADDKDLLTIPGHHCHRKVMTTVLANDAVYRHLMQTLTGDTNDGYKGCPGIGEGKAAKIIPIESYLDKPVLAWRTIVATFEKTKCKETGRYLTEDDAILQARVARILRHEDYDVATKTIRPWQPPRG